MRVWYLLIFYRNLTFLSAFSYISLIHLPSKSTINSLKSAVHILILKNLYFHLLTHNFQTSIFNDNKDMDNLNLWVRQLVQWLLYCINCKLIAIFNILNCIHTQKKILYFMQEKYLLLILKYFFCVSVIIIYFWISEVIQ